MQLGRPAELLCELPESAQLRRAFWAVLLSDFLRHIEMAAYVCVHARCSLILHEASELSCFRRTFYTVQSGK